MVYTDGIHLLAESVDELHPFAQTIGLNPLMFQRNRHPHYLLVDPILTNAHIASRAKELGAIVCTTRQLVKISRSCYFFPETDEEVQDFERRNAWHLKQPLTAATEKRLDDIWQNILKKMKKS